MSAKFCDNLKIARALSGLTQQQVADLTGIARSTYTLYESGKREPTVEGIKKIARALNLDERKAGAQAYCGHKPVTGAIAKAWEKRGYIRAVEQITRNGLKWFYQEFDRHDGQLEAVNLYDSNGDFVEEFDSYEDMTAYIDRQ